MIKNNSKLNISKNLLIIICVICLMFTSFGVIMEDSSAADIDGDAYEMGVESDVNDKLINSQDNEVMEVNSQDNVLTAQERTPGGHTFKDIKTCIDKSSDGDTIVLSGTYTPTDNKSYVYVNKKVTITSKNGATLDGKGMSGIFRVTADGVTITNLKFVNGKDESGGAIRDWACDLTIENCVFEDNHANLWGGGAVATAYDTNTSENLKIINCNFTRNHDNRDDFSNYSSAGAVGAYSKGAQIINCIFDSNWIKGDIESFGGAIQIGMDVPDNYGIVDRCIFKNNRVIAPGVGSHGGAGCVRNGVTYSNCLFLNNTAGQGGALTFHASGDIINCTFINNTADYYGGAISTGYLYDTMTLRIIECDFNGNEAPDGGAVQAIGLDVNLIDSDFTDNHATNCGGAVNIVAENVNIDNSRFNGNVAEVDGGAVYVNGVNTIVAKSSFVSNHAVPDEDKRDDGLGGAIYVNSTSTTVLSNKFEYNTARNGSAIYYDNKGEDFTLMNNILFENQAWVYQLPIHSNDIIYGETEKIKVVLYGGNNIAKYNNLAVSNAIYNAAGYDKIEIDSETPVSGATDDGRLYQDSREYNMHVLLSVTHEDGTLIYNASANTSYLGEINVELDNLKPGKYYVTAKHFEDTYYKGITNVTTFTVSPRVDNKITITTTNSTFKYEDVVVWTINITNLGPNNATGVVAYNVIPEGLILTGHTFGDKYDPKTGELDIGDLNVGEKLTYTVTTIVDRTGEIINRANVTAHETDTDMGNNFDEAVINVDPAVDLAVVKTASSKNPNYLDNITWTITVTNKGPDTAHDVYVVDLLPQSLKYIDCDGEYDAETGMWDIGTLESGKSVTLTIRCQVIRTGLAQNNISVNGSDFDYDLSNNHDEKIIYVNPASDLAIEKTVNASNVNYHDAVKWTLTITNNGPDAAENVRICDALPNGFAYVSSTLPYMNNEFKIDKVDVDETITIEIISKVNVTGEFVNVANVTSDSYDPDLTNNEDDEPIKVNPSSDLSVSKSVDDENPEYHESVTWTITVTNNGPDTAHNIQIRDVLPDALIWLGDDSSGKYNPLTGELTLESLGVGEEFELNIECMVNATGTIQNNVTVNCTEHDYNLTNNEDNEIIEVEKSADVKVTKLVSNPSPKYNELVTWTLIISNNGPDKATEIRVEDALPEGLILVNYTATKGFYDRGMWVMCCLEKGEEQRLEIVTRVNKTGKITNIAVIRAEEYDPDPENNQDNDSINVPPAVDVAVTINVDNPNPLFGSEVIWSITVVNNGPDNASNVRLNEILPDELVFVDYNSTKGFYSSGQWNIGSLNVGESQYLNVSTLSNALGRITNNVNVKSDEYDWNESNNQDDSMINVKPVADISIEKLVDNPSPSYGKTVTWILTVSNNGPNMATNVIVNDPLPEGLILVKSNGNYKNGVWNVGNLNVNETRVLKITCKVNATGNFLNYATVKSDENDPNPDDNYDEETIDVKKASDLSITKIASKYNYHVGDVVEYAIEIVNNGPDTATNIKVSEVLDDLLKLKSFKTTMGKFNRKSMTWTIDELGYGESARLYIRAIATGAGILNNTVNVTCDTFDYNLENNKDYAVVNVTEKPVNISSNNTKVVKDKIDKRPLSILEKHPTSNPFWSLIVALVFSLIFLDGRILKGR